MQRPAGIGRELHRFRARQQHAEIERREIALLAQPFPLIDDDAVHQGDLAGRTAEGEAADLRPDCRAPRRKVGGAMPVLVHLGFGLLVGQLWVSSVASRHQR